MNKNITMAALVAMLCLAALGPEPVRAQAPNPGVKGFEVEWVYRIRYGFIDEWWDLFRKYEVPVFEKLKEQGDILEYRIYHPRAHTDEASRWDYRVEIRWKDHDAQLKASPTAAALFGKTPERKRDEQRRWELTTNHWDLPIYQVDPTTGR